MSLPTCGGLLWRHPVLVIEWFLLLHSRWVFWSDHEDDLVFLVGLVRAAPVELSTSACVLCALRAVECLVWHSPCGEVMVLTTGKSYGALLSLLQQLELMAERRRLVRSGSGAMGARRRRSWHREGLFVGCGCSVWGTPRCSIPVVGLPADVATAENIATSKKASPQSDVTLSRALVSVLSGCVPISRAVACMPALADGPSGGFRNGCRAPDYYFGNSFLGAVYGGTGVCSSLTSWRARGAGWFCLWALDLVELFLPNLVEVRDVGACVVRLWFHVVASVFRVVFGPTRVVVEFLLLWLVRDWLSLLSLVREAHPPTLFRLSEIATARPVAILKRVATAECIAS
ncbi:hypothetical protein Taro_011057 [Colocasia esculenta]|uniref:Uncharacterized protein n=1 Tax=Colocasia esculenta TaxID=4460 RepID=A0A843U8U4_COLES|nr:hypothetical protein [Colocasia esculenta]